MEEMINTQLKNLLPKIIKDAMADTAVAEKAGISSTQACVDEVELPKTQHMLVLENKDSGNISDQKWSTVVKGRLKKVPVERVNFSKDKESVTIRLPNKETLDQAKALLKKTNISRKRIFYFNSTIKSYDKVINIIYF